MSRSGQHALGDSACGPLRPSITVISMSWHLAALALAVRNERSEVLEEPAIVDAVEESPCADANALSRVRRVLLVSLAGSPGSD